MMLHSSLTYAQFSGSLVNEYQLGNIPETLPRNLNTNYTRLNLQFKYKKWKAFTMLETFTTQYQQKSYFSPSQIGVYYTGNKFEFKLGNYFETIGRGNLLRSFEIPSSILEDRAYRSRVYFFRDILGAQAKYKSKLADVKVLVGKPLDNLFPPIFTFDQRRPETVAALQTDLKYKKNKLGNAFMVLQNATSSSSYLTHYLSGNILPSVNFFTEYSYSIFDETNSPTHAFYGGVNFTFHKLGGSFEVKDYKNFVLGTGINQPPALVREQTYKVLNRSIHVLQPSNETGFQLELFYELPNSQMLTFNQTGNKNNFGKEFYYTSSFLEYSKDWGKKQFKSFFDYANDGIKNEKNRVSAGAQYEFIIYSNQKLKLETEFQTMTRATSQIINQVYGITYHPVKSLSITPQLEISNDPFLTNTKNKFWLGGYVKYNASQKLNFQLFAGKRRGGPACNAGICYEVLDFEGIELRANWRF